MDRIEPSQREVDTLRRAMSTFVEVEGGFDIGDRIKEHVVRNV